MQACSCKCAPAHFVVNSNQIKAIYINRFCTLVVHSSQLQACHWHYHEERCDKTCTSHEREDTRCCQIWNIVIVYEVAI